mgnify:CR=1 FL=1
MTDVNALPIESLTQETNNNSSSLSNFNSSPLNDIVKTSSSIAELEDRLKVLESAASNNSLMTTAIKGIQQLAADPNNNINTIKAHVSASI